MYRTRQAAKYVGMKFTTFVYHINERHVKEDYRIKGERVFRKETLDEFKTKHLSDAGMTKEDIALKYGQEIPSVRGHIRRREMKPVAKSSKSHIYRTEDVELMARELGWREKSLDGHVHAVSA